MKVMVVAGGTGGHIFPALSVALEWRRRHRDIELLWVGTSRNREKELCERHDIRLHILEARGLRRSLSIEAMRSLVAFFKAVSHASAIIASEKPDAILAFGGYVSAPVLRAARKAKVPYFLHEQNTVPGLVNRLFSRHAVCTFLSFELALGWKVHGPTQLVGMPVRRVEKEYGPEHYPVGLAPSRRTLLVCGGSQGALTMNRVLIPVVRGLLGDRIQVVWQTGESGYQEVVDSVGGQKGVFVFSSIPDLYPYYAISRVVVGRSGASTLAEAAYFGLPCVLIPLPWASDDHQWINAGLAEAKGCAVRVKQDERCGETVDRTVRQLLSKEGLYEKMSRRALDLNQGSASGAIVEAIRKQLKK